MSAPRPPLPAVLAYRAWDSRPDARYDAWLREDLESRWFPWKSSALGLVGVAAIGALFGLQGWLPWVHVAVIFVLSATWVVRSAARSRGRLRARYFPDEVPAAVGAEEPRQGVGAAPDDAQGES